MPVMTVTHGYALLVLLVVIVILIVLGILVSPGIFNRNPISQSGKPQKVKDQLTEEALIARTNKIVESKGNIDEPQNQYKQTLLHIAAKYGYIQAINLLLNNGADIEAYDVPAQMTPLQRAAFCGHVEAVRLLIEDGANIEAKNAFGETSLFCATHPKTCRKEIMILLLEAGANINAKESHGQTPLFFAIDEGDDGAVQILLDHGADINAKDQLGGTPLHEATYNGQVKITELLLKYGAEVNVQDRNGLTPLDLVYDEPRTKKGTPNPDDLSKIEEILKKHGGMYGRQL